jgi:hypothetical protein
VANDASGTVELANLTASGTVAANAMTLTTALPISSGGTGGSTASAARTALGSKAVGDALFQSETAQQARDVLGPIELLVNEGHEWFLSTTSTATALGSGTSSGNVGLGRTLTSGTAVGSAIATLHGDMAWGPITYSGQTWPLNSPCEVVIHGVSLYFSNSGIDRKVRFMVGVEADVYDASASPLQGAGFGVELWLDAGVLKGQIVWHNGTGSMNTGSVFTLYPWNTRWEILGSVRLTHDGNGNIAFYISPRPTSPGRGSKRLPSTPTATCIATFTETNALGGYVTVECANSAVAVTPVAQRATYRALYLRVSE